MLLKKILTYSSSTGIQRGVAFLATIFLAKVYSLDDVGSYVLLQTTAQFSIPVLTLNLTVSICREALFSQNAVIRVIKYSTYLASLFFLFSILLYFYVDVAFWISLGVALGAGEAIFSIVNSYYIGRERANTVLIASAIKSAIFLAYLTIGLLGYLSIYELALYLAISTFLFSFAFAYVTWVNSTVANEIDDHVSPLGMVKYSLPTMTHTIGLWLSISSDRFFLNHISGPETVAEYAIYFAIAQILMLMVSGVATTIPTKVSIDSESWTTPSYVLKFFRYYLLSSIALTITNLLVLYMMINYYHSDMEYIDRPYLVVALLSIALACSIQYIFYASYLYLHRKTFGISTAIVCIVPINIIVMYFFVTRYQILGAAIGIIFVYLNFGLAYAALASKFEVFLKKIYLKVTCYYLFYIFVAIAIAMYF